MLPPAAPPRVVVVTGAGAGVGRATAVAFGRLGCKVALLSRGEERLAGAAAEVTAAGGEALPLSVDVADAGQVEAAAAAVEERLGPIDVWVNDAMATVFAPLHEITPEEFRRATEVTYLGTVWGTLAALRRMRPRDRGTIVQVGSALAYRAIPLQAPYCGAKHAVRGFSDALRCELLHDESRVRVVAVHLPALNTRQFGWCRARLPRHPQPVPPIFQPEVAAHAIVSAALHGRRESYVGLSTLLAIVGNKLAPSLADRYLARTGYDSQQTDQPLDPDRPDNLFSPLPGDGGARGIFSDRAKEQGAVLGVVQRRSLWSAVGLAALLLLVLLTG